MRNELSGTSVAKIGESRKNIFGKFFRSEKTYINVLALGIVLFIIFSLVVPKFFNLVNMFNLARRSSVNIIIAIGMTILLLCGQFDLSVPGNISLTAMIMAMMLKVGMPISLCVIFPLLLGSIIGLINGYFSTRLPSFIVTLGMLSITSGLSLFVTNSRVIHDLPESFLIIGRIEIFGFPISAVYALIIMVAAIIVTKFIVFGRHLYAIGGNKVVARRSGIPVNLRIVQSFIIMGFLSSFTALIIVTRVNAAHPVMQTDAALEAIAAAVIGGTSLYGGRGHVFGSFIGALIITMLANVFTLMAFHTSLQRVILGVILIGVIIVDYYKQKRRILR